ncbi:nicotinate-nucleotide--dimethylbenzimidazole phosphoribosyltransferase [Rubrimonas cliftonensis]|uniref:Nicotinate-nucleotide--dimethylbenzimidazole phosphoribosyltransferase n=1 Tax=Rubrimonas cliftonensis TaxID=89524 RepID=A0A1H3YBY4_9RHOB|nr:nicotinate-nucleotide--dimethylbenzimidazole phosphoribosyltransferase [Rubrimonas cliftonensis]SEA08448.1 nicotinate-nucleotide-dimethylbenzimidazole phosphoribosyltransferase [Rubrimonas cliftonensis]
MPFASLDAFRAALAAAPGPDRAARAAAEARNSRLTKPPGALGRLEEIAVWWCGWRGVARGALERPQIVVFAADHGVARRGVSPFPAEVTAQMVGNFAAGGAAINQLSRLLGARLDVVDVGVGRPTADFTEGPAMDEARFLQALGAGWDAVDPDADLFIAGEMGIGATSAASAVAAALFGGGAEAWTGRGAGVDDAGLRAKTAVVAAGLAAHPEAAADPLEALRRLGGLEMAAMAGAVAAARARRTPVLLDGFICTAAAAALAHASPGALEHCRAGHRSGEAAHGRMLDALGLEAVLDLGMRLGEGSGAAVAALTVKAALACHGGMATFAEAGVSGG